MMELMPEQEEQLNRIEETVNNVSDAIFGRKRLNQLGLLDQFTAFKLEVEMKLAEMSLRIASLETGNKKFTFGLTCVSIGILIGAGIFFGLKLKDVISFVK